MHMLFEIHRVLNEEGTLLITTPNSASWTSVHNVLSSNSNPYLFSQYPRPGISGVELGARHVREYTAHELRRALDCAGFRVDTLVTDDTCNPAIHETALAALKHLGYPTELRGEQIYCCASKIISGERVRYPAFLYEA